MTERRGGYTDVICITQGPKKSCAAVRLQRVTDRVKAQQAEAKKQAFSAVLLCCRRFCCFFDLVFATRIGRLLLEARLASMSRTLVLDGGAVHIVEDARRQSSRLK